MLRKTPLMSGETYHIYNRGAHKYATFTDDSDYSRFSALLHLANHTGPVLLGELLERYKHSGVLFQGRFKSSHLGTDPYFKWIFPYVHLNPISLIESDWQEKGISDPKRAKEFLRNYRYSSYHDYYVGERPERAILAYDEAVKLLDEEAELQDMLAS